MWPRCLPSISIVREGAQTWPLYPRENFMPFLAMRATFGVGMRVALAETCSDME